jgi:hypothetical protein
MTIATNSIRVDQSKLENTDPIKSLAQTTTWDFGVHAAEVNQAVPEEFSIVIITLLIDKNLTLPNPKCYTSDTLNPVNEMSF